MPLSDVLYLDCETQSPVDVTKVGAPVYARAVKEQGSVMCWAHALNDDEPVALWTPGLSLAWLKGHNGLFCAHNAEFEYWILREVYGIDICPERWIDTAAIARYNTLPGKLEEVGKFFGVEKDMDGSRVMLKLSRPRRPSKANPDPYWTPETKPDDFTRLYQYCRRDVEVSRMLHRMLPPLSDTETRVYQLTMRMNQRGMRVDLPALVKAKAIARADQDRISAAVKKITGYTASQVGPLAEWCGMPDGIAKHKIRDALRGKLTLPQRVVLEHRQEFAKASVKKINAFLQRQLDGYIHDGLIYGGAERTLRWTGSGVQPQNMARGAGKASLAAFEELAMGRLPDRLEDDDGKVFTSKQDILKSLVRGFILGPMLVGDFSQIEARTLAWYADDTKLLHAFATGQDPYRIMASKIYHKPVEEITKPERFMGKQAVLGCFEADTKVLTSKGWLPIIEVTKEHLLWDGKEWVRSQGAIFSGMKPTIRKHGIAATKDHLIHVGTWVPWGRLSPTDLKSALRLATLPSAGMSEAQGRESIGRLCASASADQFTHMRNTTLRPEELRGVTPAPKSKRREPCRNNTGATKIFARIRSIARACSTAFRHASIVVTTLRRRCLSTTEDAVSACIGGAVQKGAGTSCPTFLLFPGGTTPLLRLTESMSTGVMLRAISALLPKQKMQRTSGHLPILRPVFDISNSGPRHRFTVLTSHGAVLAHNCGYQLGKHGFQYMLDVTYDTQISEGEAEKIISAYRAASPTVVRFWGRIERTIRAARGQDKGLYIKKPLGVKWTDEETFFIRLPSGRKVWYRQVEMTDHEITCFGRLKTGGYGRIKIYGGAITGHIVQTTARELMAAALLRLDEEGFELFLTVHDEAVSRDGDLEKLARIMRQSPKWAVGLPIDVDCFRTERYRK
jgi:hypothetical protein